MAEIDDLQAQILQAQQSIAQLQGGGAPAGGAAPVQNPMQYGAVPLPRGGAQNMGGGAQGGMTPQQMQQVYGLLSQYGDNPEAAGAGYVDAMQNQQTINQTNSPIEQYMRLYGNVNPFDFTADSLQKFHENLTSTGQLDFGLLDRKQTRVGEEAMNAAQTAAYEAHGRSNRMMNMETRFQQTAAQGAVGGAVTTLGNWWRGIGGSQNEYDQLQAEYNQIRGAGVMNALPPGAASDADVNLAKSGWPAANADPAFLAMFLRGARKMAVIDAAYNDEYARYMSTHPNSAGWTDHWKDIGDQTIQRYFDGQGLQYFQAPEGMSTEDAARMRYQSYFDTSANLSATPGAPGVSAPGGGPAGIPDGATTDDLVAMARKMNATASHTAPGPSPQAPAPQSRPPQLPPPQGLSPALIQQLQQYQQPPQVTPEQMRNVSGLLQ